MLLHSKKHLSGSCTCFLFFRFATYIPPLSHSSSCHFIVLSSITLRLWGGTGRPQMVIFLLQHWSLLYINTVKESKDSSITIKSKNIIGINKASNKKWNCITKGEIKKYGYKLFLMRYLVLLIYVSERLYTISFKFELYLSVNK